MKVRFYITVNHDIDRGLIIVLYVVEWDWHKECHDQLGDDLHFLQILHHKDKLGTPNLGGRILGHYDITKTLSTKEYPIMLHGLYLPKIVSEVNVVYPSLFLW